MSAHAIPILTPEQYLEIDRTAEIKSEYYNGQMFAMSGGSLSHSLFAATLTTAVGNSLRGRKCRVATSDLRVRVSPRGPFLYPDLTVYCGDPELADDYRDMLLNPTAIFEIPSGSSEGYDRGLKFAHYRQMESVGEYVLVFQSEARVEVFTRQPEGTWLLSEFAGADADCRLASLDCEIRLSDIYQDIEFAA